jgi:nicotinamide-nucleotide amidase
MHAEVMSIGDELTNGQRLDTNTQWLSQRLGDCGIPVRFHTTVADELSDLVQAFQAAIGRAHLVIVTGGLGPTADDLTRDALAAATGRELELRPDALAHVEQMFLGRGRTMPERNRIQAMFPQGSRIIPNPHGTAPGIDLEAPAPHGSTRLFALPGVPAEMIEMWNETVQPAVLGMLPEPRLLRHHRVKCFGVGESHLESMLPDLIRRDREPRVGITVHQATITLRITAGGLDEEACRAAMQPTIETIHECLGPLVFGEEDDELEHAVLRALRRAGQTLAVCEWATQGLVNRWLQQAWARECADAASEAGSPLVGGLVLNDERQLAAWLGDENAAAGDHGNEESRVLWMAERVRQQAGSDWGLAIGPGPDPTVPDPQVVFALAGRDDRLCERHGYLAHPEVRLPRAAKQALDLVRRTLNS